jgi:hypothetical protein
MGIGYDLLRPSRSAMKKPGKQRFRRIVIRFPIAVGVVRILAFKTTSLCETGDGALFEVL